MNHLDPHVKPHMVDLKLHESRYQPDPQFDGRKLSESITTRSGKYFWPLDPRPNEVDVADIAWGLAHELRFGGQSIYPYSVAIHSKVLSEIVPPKLAKWALMHDSTEAYFKDIQRPIKSQMPEYKVHEKRLMKAISQHFNLDPLEEPIELKKYDPFIGHVEMVVLFPGKGERRLRDFGYGDAYIKSLTKYTSLINSYTTMEAYGLWLSRYYDLFGGVK